MSVARKLCKSYFNDFIHRDDCRTIEQTARSIIYQYGYDNDVTIITDDSSKMMYYTYAKEHKHKHIPKINEMLYDWKNGLYLINREELFPCTNTKKMAEIDKIKMLLKDRQRYNAITEELLNFFYDVCMDCNINFDFGPHWLMETGKGKLVVADAFKCCKPLMQKQLL